MQHSFSFSVLCPVVVFNKNNNKKSLNECYSSRTRFVISALLTIYNTHLRLPLSLTPSFISHRPNEQINRTQTQALPFHWIIISLRNRDLQSKQFAKKKEKEICEIFTENENLPKSLSNLNFSMKILREKTNNNIKFDLIIIIEITHYSFASSLFTSTF